MKLHSFTHGIIPIIKELVYNYLHIGKPRTQYTLVIPDHVRLSIAFLIHKIPESILEHWLVDNSNDIILNQDDTNNQRTIEFRTDDLMAIFLLSIDLTEPIQERRFNGIYTQNKQQLKKQFTGYIKQV